jgi:hypothetical protein
MIPEQWETRIGELHPAQMVALRVNLIHVSKMGIGNAAVTIH